jgi:hypothetical protein
MRWALQAMWTVTLSATVCALEIGLYDLTVRQPRTPRLAVVDISRLFQAAEQRAKEGVLAAASRTEGGMPAPATTHAAELAGLQATESFGPNLQKVLTDLSTECRCAIVAMAAVTGGGSTVPDYTQEAAARLGVNLRLAQRGQ